MSKAGLGYLIVYGGQVFQLDLVMTGVIILAIVAAVMYQAVVITEKIVVKRGWVFEKDINNYYNYCCYYYGSGNIQLK